jgi:hypothetical protein
LVLCLESYSGLFKLEIVINNSISSKETLDYILKYAYLSFYKNAAAFNFVHNSDYVLNKIETYSEFWKNIDL